jgi:hypothetical protein
VFRRRLGAERFRRCFDAPVARCRGAGLLEGRRKVVDATHVVADVAIPTTVNLLPEARTKTVAAIEAGGGSGRPDLRERDRTDEEPRGVPTARVLAESVSLGEELLADTAEVPGPRVAAARALLTAVLHPTGARLSGLVDTDARVGHEAPTRTVVGDKLHVAQDTSERVTTVQAPTGNVDAGSRLPELLDEEEREGIRQPAVVADKPYDAARNRALVQRLGATARIPRRDRLRVDRFTDDPATDSLRCPRGQTSARRDRDGHRTRDSVAPAQCRACPEADRGPPPNKGRVRIAIADHHPARLRGAPSSMPTIEYERERIERTFGQATVHHGTVSRRPIGGRAGGCGRGSSSSRAGRSARSRPRSG